MYAAMFRVKPLDRLVGEAEHALGAFEDGQAILEDYRASESSHPGSIFAMAVTDDDRVDYFTHRPYERLWGITHEDLSPMFFQATVRGALL